MVFNDPPHTREQVHRESCAQRISCLPQEEFTSGLGLENTLLTAAAGTLPTEVNDTKCHGDHAAAMSSSAKTGQRALGEVYVEEQVRKGKNGTHKRSVCVGCTSNEKQIYPTRLNQ